jgi:hypothetical protein
MARAPRATSSVDNVWVLSWEAHRGYTPMEPSITGARESLLIGVLAGTPSPAASRRKLACMSSPNDVRGEIRQFLTTRRAKLTPAQAGLPTYGGRRRVPGLCREEVALLAGISIEYYTRAPHDRALTELVGELSLRSQAFRVRWAAHDVDYYRSGVQPFHHPLVGDLTLDYDALELPAHPGQTVVAYTAEPGSPAHQALDPLASWTSTPDHPPAVTTDT